MPEAGYRRPLPGSSLPLAFHTTSLCHDLVWSLSSLLYTDHGQIMAVGGEAADVTIGMAYAVHTFTRQAVRPPSTEHTKLDVEVIFAPRRKLLRRA